MSSIVLVLAACSGKDDAATPGDPPGPPPDLTVRLGEGEVRAGVVTDEVALFGGVSAEGRAGDLKIYNDRVQFVIQSVRGGSWYLPEGGGVIDADIVRPEGQLGRDAVEEWAPMFGLGRITMPETVEVIADGSDGEAAVIRVVGYESPLGLLEGALEAPGFVPPFGLEMVTEYRLEPDSWLLQATTTVTATTVTATLAVGDLILGADEVLDPFVPGDGIGTDGGEPRLWSGYVATRNDVALILVAPPGEVLSVSGYELLTSLASMVVGFSPTVPIAPGTPYTWTRYWGVGPDLGTLSTAALELHGAAAADASGTVTAPDGPVAGARVIVDVDGSPYTVAVTDADGGFSVAVPAGTITTRAEGRGPALFLDLPEGYAPISPYAAAPVHAAQLEGLRSGAVPLPLAEGRGIADAATPLVLGEPATLVVTAADGLPFSVRLAFQTPDPDVDQTRFPDRPNDLAAAGWARDGEVRMLVEPGTYTLVAYRGPRFELHQSDVTLAAGETVNVGVSLPAGFAHAGWVLGDTHIHASPSPDGDVTMEDRLVIAAANGLQVHFGTDHDHLADYRPLLEPLGLTSVLKSVVSDEVSPPMRGHFNIYPVEPSPGEANNGAWTWWEQVPENTEAIVDTLRERHGPDFVFQSNHPLDSGVGSSASWVPGTIRNGDFWTDRLEAVEILNSGSTEDYLDFWMDLALRAPTSPTPLGVSDSHGRFSGSFGLSSTWFEVGTDDPTAVSDEVISQTIRSGHVIPSLGVLLVPSVSPGSTVDAGSSLTVEARTSSWIIVDRIRLLRDGVEEQVVDGTSATFVLDPAADALYTVIAEGDTPMLPIEGRTPWAFAGPYRVDVGGNGWTPPLPPLVVE